MYSASANIVDAIDCICGMYMHLPPQYICIKYIAYMCMLAGIFVFGTCMMITSEVGVAIGVVLKHTCVNVGSM